MLHLERALPHDQVAQPLAIGHVEADAPLQARLRYVDAFAPVPGWSGGFAFVDSVAAAVDRARVAAGEQDVVIMGGGDVIAQAIEQGLVDELHLDRAPVIVGGGTPCSGTGTPYTSSANGSRRLTRWMSVIRRSKSGRGFARRSCRHRLQ